MISFTDGRWSLPQENKMTSIGHSPRSPRGPARVERKLPEIKIQTVPTVNPLLSTSPSKSPLPNDPLPPFQGKKVIKSTSLLSFPSSSLIFSLTSKQKIADPVWFIYVLEVRICFWGARPLKPCDYAFSLWVLVFFLENYTTLLVVSQYGALFRWLNYALPPLK